MRKTLFDNELLDELWELRRDEFLCWHAWLADETSPQWFVRPQELLDLERMRNQAYNDVYVRYGQGVADAVVEEGYLAAIDLLVIEGPLNYDA